MIKQLALHATYARSEATGVQDGERNPGMGAFF